MQAVVALATNFTVPVTVLLFKGAVTLTVSANAGVVHKTAKPANTNFFSADSPSPPPTRRAHRRRNVAGTASDIDPKHRFVRNRSGPLYWMRDRAALNRPLQQDLRSGEAGQKLETANDLK